MRRTSVQTGLFSLPDFSSPLIRPIIPCRLGRLRSSVQMAVTFLKSGTADLLEDSLLQAFCCRTNTVKNSSMSQRDNKNKCVLTSAVTSHVAFKLSTAAQSSRSSRKLYTTCYPSDSEAERICLYKQNSLNDQQQDEVIKHK